MIKRLKRMWLYLLIQLCIYLILTPGGTNDTWWSVLFILIFGLVALVNNFIFGLRVGIDLLMPFLGAATFIPGMLIFLGPGYWYFMSVYAGLGVIGLAIGDLIRLRRNRDAE